MEVETINESSEGVIVPEPVVVTIEPEKEYRFQPKDESGRKIGGEQVIKYRTQDELVQKLTEQNINIHRALREQTKKQRLGIVDAESIPEEAPKFNLPLDFSPRQLTPDERVKLSRDLLDPEMSEEATNTLFEAALGRKPQVLMKEFSSLSADVLSLRAKIESDAFMEGTPDYYPCRENFDAITGWMVKNDLAPVRQNFGLAFDTLKELGIMIGAPAETLAPVVPLEMEEVIHEEPIVEVPVREKIPEAVIPTVPVAPRVTPPPTGLKGNDTVPLAPKPKYTLADINKMSGEDYKKRLLHEKGFPEIVEKLEQEAVQKARQRMVR